MLAPFLQSYVLSGGFTFWQRTWDSIKENVILYAVLGVVGAGALIYIGVAYQMDMFVPVYNARREQPHRVLTQCARTPHRGVADNRNALLDFVKLLANAYGLLLIVVFMSYGIIDVPRRLWYHGSTSFQIRYVQFKAPSYREDYEEAETNLRDIYKVPP